MSKICPLMLALFFAVLASQSSGEGIKDERIKETGKTVVAGRVTNTDGKPMAGARLIIVDTSSESDPLYRSETKSDGDGRFSLNALPGNSRLSVFADGYVAMYRRHDVVQGVNRGWDFALPPGAHISGRILDTKGNPAPQRLLELQPVKRGPPPVPGVSFCGNMQRGRTTDANGVFDIQDVAPGKYSIRVYGSSLVADRCLQQEPVRGKFLEVRSGERVQGFEIRVNPPEDYVIAGHVRDARGKPIPPIVVSATYNLPHDGATWWTQTDENGAFCIKGLDGMGLSSCRVNFDLRGAGVYKLAIPDVPINTKNVDFIVPDKGSIHGTVRNAKTGEMVTTYEVTVPVVTLPETKAVWEQPPVQIERNTDSSFRISNVPAGQATIEVRAGELGAQRFGVQVAADKTNSIQCEMLGPAVLTVQTTLKGKPTSTWVIINKEKWFCSDKDGKIRFNRHPNGDYTIWFFVGENWFRSAEVHLKSGETTHLDMDIGGSCEVRGSIRFPEEEPFCTVRLASKPTPNGWWEGRPHPDEFVLACSSVQQSGGEYHLDNIPPGRYYLMAGRLRPSMNRSVLALSKVIELKEGQTLSLDLDLTDTGEQQKSDHEQRNAL